MIENQAFVVHDAGNRFHYLEPLGGTSDSEVIKDAKGNTLFGFLTASISDSMARLILKTDGTDERNFFWFLVAPGM